jgi:predicted RNA-binding Zn ribbon-like protein
MDEEMAFEWHDHHFINDVACLDFANTVVYRPFPEKREDRLRSLADLTAWIAAAKLGSRSRTSLKEAIALREAIDSLFRGIASTNDCRPPVWTDFIDHYRHVIGVRSLQRTSEGLGMSTQQPPAFAEIAHSALTLSLSPLLARVKVCSGCGWLFIDRTRNAKKKWCISSMCGSRDKARRYYARKVHNHSGG